MTQLWAPTEYPHRSSQDSNPIYASSQLDLPQYSSSSGVGFVSGHGTGHYSTMSPTYSTYPSAYGSSQNSGTTFMYIPTSDGVPMSYQMQPPPAATLPSQSRSVSNHAYYPPQIQTHRFTHQHCRASLAPEISLHETEEQDSPNQETMRSEPVDPPLEGYPNVHEFDDLMKQYVRNLSPKKQDKALIHAKRAANIKAVLIDKKTTSVESAQFRFWVKKMFTLEPKDPSVSSRKKKICHEMKPVAIREKLFKILTQAHKQCQHGGRDKTSAQVRRVYSWVPKELISRFVKLCPTCQVRRGTSRASPSVSERSSVTFGDIQSPVLNSSRQLRRQSVVASPHSTMHSPLQISRFPSAFQQQNRWMTPIQTVENTVDQVSTLDAAASAMVNIHMNSSVSSENLAPATSKFADDPGTPYMHSNHLQNEIVNSPVHSCGFNDIDIVHQQDPSYRLKRGTAFKREREY